MLGPVFAWELVRASRRRWHWWARALYIGLLLILLFAAFDAYERRADFRSSHVNHRVLAELGHQFYQGFSLCQLVAVLALSPIFAATSIAEEKSRQTLPFLLTSRLHDAEIVFSKIGLSVLRVAEVLLCGVPFCAICLLLGGVTPQTMALDFLVAFSAACACCALGVLTAIHSRKLVEGLFLVCLAQLIWYMLPVVDTLARASSRGTWYVPAMLVDLNAFRVIWRGQTTRTGLDEYLACLGATMLCCAACSIAAWLTLRPAWRREQENSGRTISLVGWLKRGRAGRAAQLVWDQPCLWRELRSRRPTSVDRIVWVLYIAAALGVLISIGWNWMDSLETLRLSQGRATGMPPISLIIGVYALFLYLQFLALPYLTICGASAFSEEREGNHWELLRATLLEQRELVWAKVARLARLEAGILVFPIVLMLLTVAIGWGTLVGLFLASLHAAAAGAFWLMLGLAIGLRATKTSQAIAIAMSLFLVMSIGLPMIAVWIAPNVTWYALLSSPMHCMFLEVFDTALDRNELPPNMTLAEFRGLSLLYSIVLMVGAGILYLWTLVPAGPWQAGEGEYDVQPVRRMSAKPLVLSAPTHPEG